jgi:hypothetical protein
MTIELRIEFDAHQIAKLMRIPILLRLTAAERTLKAMAKPVLARAKALAPDSSKPGPNGVPSKTKQSANTRKKWPEQGKNNLGFVFRKSESGGYLVIGAKSPKGNTLNFDSSERGRKVRYWLNPPTGRIKRVPPSERFMQRAFDETRQEQMTAGFNQLEKEIRELNLG